jgi:hypothetical protein
MLQRVTRVKDQGLCLSSPFFTGKRVLTDATNEISAARPNIHKTLLVQKVCCIFLLKVGVKLNS